MIHKVKLESWIKNLMLLIILTKLSRDIYRFLEIVVSSFTILDIFYKYYWINLVVQAWFPSLTLITSFFLFSSLLIQVAAFFSLRRFSGGWGGLTSTITRSNVGCSNKGRIFQINGTVRIWEDVVEIRTNIFRNLVSYTQRNLHTDSSIT